MCVCVYWCCTHSYAAGPWCLPGSHVCSYSKSDVVFWNSLASPSENKSCVLGRVVSVDEEGGGRGGSVLRIRLSPLARYTIIPCAALSLILGFVVTDSKLLCHLFFPRCYFLPPHTPPIACFSHQTIPQLLRERKKNKRCVSHHQLIVLTVHGKS